MKTPSFDKRFLLILFVLLLTITTVWLILHYTEGIAKSERALPALYRQNKRLIIPEGSALRERISIATVYQ